MIISDLLLLLIFFWLLISILNAFRLFRIHRKNFSLDSNLSLSLMVNLYNLLDPLFHVSLIPLMSFELIFQLLLTSLQLFNHQLLSWYRWKLDISLWITHFSFIILWRLIFIKKLFCNILGIIENLVRPLNTLLILNIYDII